MPDWVTHLGTTYIAAGAVGKAAPKLTRFLEMRYLLLGALLPDVTRFTVILVDVLDWPAMATFTYLIPFHSLLIVSLISGAMALLMPTADGNSFKAFGLIMVGSALHFLLDDLEGVVGCGSTTFYPLYFGKPLSGWHSEGNLAATLLVVSAIGLGVALVRRSEWSPITFCFSGRRLLGTVLLLGVAVLIPLFFRQWMIDRNAYYLGFITNPSAFEEQPVALCFSEVIDTRPPTIEEFDTPFELQTDLPLARGEWVSVRGIYRNGRIWPETLMRHRGFSDVHLSLIAAVLFLILLIDPHQLKSRLFLKEFGSPCAFGGNGRGKWGDTPQAPRLSILFTREPNSPCAFGGNANENFSPSPRRLRRHPSPSLGEGLGERAYFQRRNSMEEESRKQLGMMVGGLIGAVLGAGAAYLLMTAPSDEEDVKPVTGREIVSLTSAVAILIRRIDDFRRRI